MTDIVTGRTTVETQRDGEHAEAAGEPVVLIRTAFGAAGADELALRPAQARDLARDIAAAAASLEEPEETEGPAAQPAAGHA